MATIDKYITYLRSIRGYSENTIRAYENDLHTFAKWMHEQDQYARWSTIDRTDLDTYLIYQQRRGLKPASTNRHLAAISSLYDYFKRCGMDVENPTKYESRRKIGDRIPNTIAINQLRQAYEHAEGATRTMLGILATTGIRIQELLDICFEDVNVEDSSIKIQGKGSKQRIVYTQPAILEPIAEEIEKNQASGQIFPIDQRTARYAIWKALSPYCNARQLSPHAIRHTFATRLATQGENVATISSVLGHKQIKTTQKYIDMTQMDIKNAANRAAMFN